MTDPTAAEVKWDVASPERLGELRDAPAPAGLRVTATTPDIIATSTTTPPTAPSHAGESPAASGSAPTTAAS